MKCLWVILVLPTVLGQVGFGRSYLRNSRLCHSWHCLNQKLGLPDDLPDRQLYGGVLKRLLPEGAWHTAADKALDVCYGNRPRTYTNTCPGQALMHCVVDQLIENCVEESWRKDDACSDVYSLAGLKFMFSQSVYEDLEKNLPKERRPEWFMHNYFDTKCCNLPEMFNATILGECGFQGFMTYYTHAPKYNTAFDTQKFKGPEEFTDGPFLRYRGGEINQFYSKDYGLYSVFVMRILVNHLQLNTATQNDGDKIRVASLAQFQNDNKNNVDPLDCCDMSEFIEPAWRSECNFHLSWEGQSRLVIRNGTEPVTESMPTTTTERPNVIKDLVFVPDTCEKETCVFRALNIVSASGTVDKDAYLKMLDNFTDAHPSWTNAKARVVTKCLSKPRLPDYEADCEINKILACTFDVLTENCPFAKKSDLCKHRKDKTGCQISSSKYRPKNRREICLLPELLNREHLIGCGMESIRRVQHVTVEMPKPKKRGFPFMYACKDTTPSTRCLMKKMNVLNKYNFMDYFKMKDKIRRFTQNGTEWENLSAFYFSAFNNFPLYREHCSSGKKLLNVIDSVLMTCPTSKWKVTPQCIKIATAMATISPVKQTTNPVIHDEILKHFHQIFLPETPVNLLSDKVTRRKQFKLKVVKKPVFDYGLLHSGSVPKVRVIGLKPQIKNVTKPLVILPVYLRKPKHGQAPYNDGVFRSNPFWLHTQIAVADKATNNSNTTKTQISTMTTVPPISIRDPGFSISTARLSKNSNVEIMTP